MRINAIEINSDILVLRGEENVLEYYMLTTKKSSTLSEVLKRIK